MDGKKRHKDFKIYQGILFILGILGLYIGISYVVPVSWGIGGTAVVQLFFIVSPLVFTVLMGRDPGKIFPFRKPTWMGIGGTVVLWVGSFLINMAVSGLLTYLFPAASSGTGTKYWELIGDTPGIILLLVTAVMPAVGEELTFRGVFFHSLGRIRWTWAAAVITGVVFGAFHMDLVKLLPTSMIGVLLCLSVARSGNMFYNSLFHFLNNGVITALMLLVRSFMKFSPSYRKMFEYTLEEMPSGQMTLAAVGLYWIFAAAAPFLIYLGYWMLPKEQGRRKPLFGGGTLVRDVLVIVTASAVFLAGGFLCLLTSLR